MHKFNYGRGADIWATGIMLYRLLTNTHPIVNPGQTQSEAKQAILDFNKLEFPDDCQVSIEAKHLLERMIAKEQSNRYSASEALKHPWITRD